MTMEYAIGSSILALVKPLFTSACEVLGSMIPKQVIEHHHEHNVDHWRTIVIVKREPAELKFGTWSLTEFQIKCILLWFFLDQVIRLVAFLWRVHSRGWVYEQLRAIRQALAGMVAGPSSPAGRAESPAGPICPVSGRASPISVASGRDESPSFRYPSLPASAAASDDGAADKQAQESAPVTPPASPALDDDEAMHLPLPASPAASDDGASVEAASEDGAAVGATTSSSAGETDPGVATPQAVASRDSAPTISESEGVEEASLEEASALDGDVSAAEAEAAPAAADAGEAAAPAPSDAEAGASTAEAVTEVAEAEAGAAEPEGDEVAALGVGEGPAAAGTVEGRKKPKHRGGKKRSAKKRAEYEAAAAAQQAAEEER